MSESRPVAGDPEPQFVERADADGVLVVDPEFDAAVAALGLPRREAAAELFAKAPESTGRAQTVVVDLPGREDRLHLRPLRHGGLLSALWGSRVLGLARPRNELRVTEVLRRRGAPVPRPVLVAGWRQGPFWSALVGTVHLEDSRDGVAWLAGDPDGPERLRVAGTAGRAIRRFHDCGGRHADLHLKNLLVRADDVFVIDLDKAQAGAPPDPARRLHELMRLYRSVIKRRAVSQLGQDALDAVFDGYVAGDAHLEQAMLRHLPRERRRVARHVAGYRRTSP